MARTRRWPMPETYSSTDESLSSGISFCTCAAASCPSFTSSDTLYLLGGGTIWVCADAVATATVSRKTGTIRTYLDVDMAEFISDPSAMRLPIRRIDELGD